MMTTTVVCIAKNEDHYINQWIQYYLSIGFDKIIVYCNDWSFSNVFGEKVIAISWPGKAQQLIAYNDFIANRANQIDWALVVDCDEFLFIGKHKNVKELLSQYNDFFAVAFNWKVFGSNSMLHVTDDNYDVIRRFTKSQIGFNDHVKIALNIRKLTDANLLKLVRFPNPHNINLSMMHNIAIDAAKTKYVSLAWNKIPQENQILNGIPYIAHYMTKSRQEFVERRSRVRADINALRDNIEQIWKEYDLNEVENLDVVNCLNAHDII